jgi:phage FluMu gp28-like protein
MQIEQTIYKGGKLHPGQQSIANDIISTDAMYYTICCPRQWGKSFLITQLLLYFSINNKNSISMLCSPTYQQSVKLFDELYKGVANSNIVKDKNRSNYEINLINGSKILFKSLQLPDNIRGYSIDYLYVDEAAMVQDKIFSEILRPMLTVRGKKCFLLSTPKGKNYFYNMFKMSEVNERYKAYIGTNTENPYSNKDEIEDARLTLPDAIFRQEYMGEFISDGGEVFNNLDACAVMNFQEPKGGETYYAGLDLGRANDFTVLTILNNKNEVVYVYRKNQTTWSIMVEDIMKILNKYNARLYVEVNSIGDVIGEMIKGRYKNTEYFQTTHESKSMIVEHLISEFQNNTIKIPKKEVFPTLINELQDFSFKYSKASRKILYSARNGHDDAVISLCLAVHAKKCGGNYGKYFVQ